MHPRLHSQRSSSGFTLTEALVVIVMAGILSAIAAPSWLSFLNRQRVNAAQDQALQTLRLAQAKAMRENRVWVASFREEDDRVQWSVHPTDATAPIWQDLTESSDLIKIDRENSDFADGCAQEVVSCVRFTDRGTLEGDFQYQDNAENSIGQIIFTTADSEADSENAPKRCVEVATLLGSLRTAKDDNCG